MNITNNTGPRTEPCGTPCRILINLDDIQFKTGLIPIASNLT